MTVALATASGSPAEHRDGGKHDECIHYELQPLWHDCPSAALSGNLLFWFVHERPATPRRHEPKLSHGLRGDQDKPNDARCEGEKFEHDGRSSTGNPGGEHLLFVLVDARRRSGDNHIHHLGGSTHTRCRLVAASDKNKHHGCHVVQPGGARVFMVSKCTLASVGRLPGTSREGHTQWVSFGGSSVRSAYVQKQRTRLFGEIPRGLLAGGVHDHLRGA